MTVGTIYWHDYETFGADPRWDRPAQFAGLRTDENLNVIGEPLVLYCQPANDLLPDPEACLVTGITPQVALQKGVPEAQFIAAIHEQFARPGTCGAGFNSIRFDDEVTRHCLYRNFFDPYAREWQNGNSRWDIIDMLRLARALRPEGIEWPNAGDGMPSFRLEELSRANQIEHSEAHDALADVHATIAVARLVRDRTPRLYAYVYENRRKPKIASMLNPDRAKPVLHVSGMYPASEGCIAPVVPVIRHPLNNNGVIVYNLTQDPADLLELEAAEIRRRVFTAQQDLAPDESRIALKTVHLNRCPVVVPISTMRQQDAERLAIDMDHCLAHWTRIQNNRKELSEKLLATFSLGPESTTDDPDLMLYQGGFFGPADRKRMDAVRTLPPDSLAEFDSDFDDRRVAEMLFRYRARNYPESLSETETERWNRYRIQRLTQGGDRLGLGLEGFRRRIDELRAEPARDQQQIRILDELEAWGNQIAGEPQSPGNQRLNS